MTDMSKRAVEVAAQCWCDPKVSNREMDVELAKVFSIALVAFAEERVKEDRAKHNERTMNVVHDIRNAALEEAAKIAEFHSGPSIQLADKIRALKKAEWGNC